MARECGECSLCCKVPSVDELKKPMGRWCEHARIGKGCAIYADRPPSCRSFQCMWLMGWGEDRDRPDALKVVLQAEGDPKTTGPVVGVMESYPGSAKTGRAKRLLDAISLKLPTCSIPAGGGKRTLTIPKNYPADRVALLTAELRSINEGK